MRSWADRLTSRTASQRSGFIRASVRSRVMPALWTTTSTPPWRSCRWAASVAGASAAVTSSASDEPPIALATLARSSPWAAMSMAMTWAPSRASVWAIAAPMPREAPVTATVRPACGFSQSSGAGDAPGPMRMTCPDT